MKLKYCDLINGLYDDLKVVSVYVRHFQIALAYITYVNLAARFI